MSCPSAEIKKRLSAFCMHGIKFTNKLLKVHFHQLCLQTNIKNNLCVRGQFKYLWVFSKSLKRKNSALSCGTNSQPIYINQLTKCNYPIVRFAFSAHSPKMHLPIFIVSIFFLYTQAPTTPNHMHANLQSLRTGDCTLPNYDVRKSNKNRNFLQANFFPHIRRITRAVTSTNQSKAHT